MLKLRNKILNSSAYLLLLCYITIVTANIFHHHNVDLIISEILTDQHEEKQKNHFNFIGSEAVCLVQIAYNAVNNITPAICDADKNIQNEPDLPVITADTEKIVKSSILNFSLRAPPLLHLLICLI